MANEKTNRNFFAEPFDTISIPDFAGAQRVTARYQRRTQLQYAFLSIIGVLGFWNSKNSHVRVAGLSCLFPGAGFLAVGGVAGAFGLILSVAFLPLSIFAWFGAGGLAFVLANWIVPTLISTAIAGESVWEPAGPIVVVVALTIVISLVIGGQRRYSHALKVRESRNALLEKEKVAWKSRAKEKSNDAEKRELSIEDLRKLQHFVQVAHQAMGDWSNFVHIDQFQTSAFRYQLYFLQYTLAFVQKFYMPNFQGYIKEAQIRCIDKSTTKEVMNYWKWESLWGKFTLDWDPVVRDNIMVTGYILLCLSLYEKLNGDDRYSQKDSLNFRITDGAQYRHNAESVFEALMKNWDQSSYCLFPCEPNWIYSGCNLVGMQGALAYESLKHTGRVGPLLSGPYHRAFEEDFMNADGSIVPLRSTITGFPLIGIAGVLGDLGGAVLCAPSMPNIARRLWLVSRNSHVRKSNDGKYTLENLVGADKMDLGNYKSGSGYACVVFAQCAAEFGDIELARGLIAHMENELNYPTVESPFGNGATMTEGLSMKGSLWAFRARTQQQGDWSELINSPPDTVALAAPKLDSVPFPRVMVARCHAEGETGLSFVLRGPAEPKRFTIGFKDLRSQNTYKLFLVSGKGKKTDLVNGIMADVDGTAKVTVEAGDRSEFELSVAA